MIPVEIHQQVRRIQIRTRRLVDGAFAGEYHSIFKGRGMEFAEVREYMPGDDVRMIDWNVTARMGQPFVKQQVEERELTVMLLIDLSGSVRFGSRSKLKTEIAAEIAAVIALSALRNNDRVGVILFSDRIEKFIPPQKGKTRALQVLREVLTLQPQGQGTNIALALDYLQKLMSVRTVSFLLSDFLATGFDTSLRTAKRRHDMIPVCINDRHERDLPAVGLALLRDLETGEQVVVDTSNRRLRQQFAEQRKIAINQRRQLFQTLGLQSIEIDTGVSFVDPMIRFFRQRERGRRL